MQAGLHACRHRQRCSARPTVTCKCMHACMLISPSWWPACLSYLVGALLRLPIVLTVLQQVLLRAIAADVHHVNPAPAPCHTHGFKSQHECTHKPAMVLHAHTPTTRTRRCLHAPGWNCCQYRLQHPSLAVAEHPTLGYSNTGWQPQLLAGDLQGTQSTELGGAWFSHVVHSSLI